MGSPEHIGTSYFSHRCNEILDRNMLKEDNFLLAHGLRRYRTLVAGERVGGSMAQLMTVGALSVSRPGSRQIRLEMELA